VGLLIKEVATGEGRTREHEVVQSKKVNAIDDRSLLDETAILFLNNAHAKETYPLDDSGLTELLDMAFYARGIDRGAIAFLIALDQNAAYRSPNFLWFKESRALFVYIDRIIVSSSARGQGVARLLYEDLFVAAKEAGHDRVVCEVNLEPPNPASEAFHIALGFGGVGQASIHNGTKIVRYFEKKLR
jgi:predicted GNAT superfamily acetyltransferase